MFKTERKIESIFFLENALKKEILMLMFYWLFLGDELYTFPLVTQLKTNKQKA